MTRNRFLILCSAAALSASVLTGCEAEEDSCQDDSECGDGFICDGATEDEPGTCIAGPTGTACTDDTPCNTGYVCNNDAGICFEGCTETASECAADYQCDGADDAAGTLGTCIEIPMVPYTYAIVTSEVPPTSEDITGTNTPGPDIDFISLTQGSTVLNPTVETNVEGMIGDGEGAGNATDGVNGILAQDAMTGAGPTFDCDPNDGALYWSMGANDGFLAVSFGAGVEILDGNIIAVYELSAASCDTGVDRNRADAYGVYIHNGTVPATAAEIRADGGACSQGVSGGDGGYDTFQVSLATCGAM